MVKLFLGSSRLSLFVVVKDPSTLGGCLVFTRKDLAADTGGLKKSCSYISGRSPDNGDLPMIDTFNLELFLEWEFLSFNISKISSSSLIFEECLEAYICDIEVCLIDERLIRFVLYFAGYGYYFLDTFLIPTNLIYLPPFDFS